MNEELKLSREQLEAATSRRNVETLDSETASLAENFRAFGQAAEQADADFDETALIERLQRSLLDQSSSPVIASQSRATPSIWPLLLSGAIAASALIAAVRIAATWPAHSPQVVVASDSQDRNEHRALTPATREDNAPAQSTLSEQVYVSWHDDLDDEISAAQSVLAGVAGKSASLDGSLSSIDEQLEAMASDLTEGSL